MPNSCTKAWVIASCDTRLVNALVYFRFLCAEDLGGARAAYCTSEALALAEADAAVAASVEKGGPAYWGAKATPATFARTHCRVMSCPWPGKFEVQYRERSTRAVHLLGAVQVIQREEC